MSHTTDLDTQQLYARVEALFASAGPPESMRMGAELELIPLDEVSHRPILIQSSHPQSSLEIIRSVAVRMGWSEIPAGSDPPSWKLPDGGRVSFEPGGQMELSSAPSESPSRLVRDLQCTAQLLSSAFANVGIALESSGVDPYNEVADVDLQLHRPRYELMTRYFNSIGTSGIRMMRQTASLQINVDLGTEPHERWLLLNSLAPYVTAIFANSPLYAGEPTGYRSYRSYLWRSLDKSRTGSFLRRGNPARDYFEFALRAGAMMRDADGYGSFGDWIREGEPTIEDWDTHLTTLFPEVRPRGYFELRSADAIDPQDLAAPLTFVAGLVYDPCAAEAAMTRLSSIAAPSLHAAGREGLGNPAIADIAVWLVDLALAGCASLGDEYVSRVDIDSAADFFDRYTRQGRSPGDDRS